MEGFDWKRVSACACFMAAYVLAYIVIGSFDSAYDFFSIPDEIARHDAERTLSAVFDIAIVLGLLSIWVYDVRSWRGGMAVGMLTALAAGGVHVAAHMTGWLPLSMAAGFAGALVFMVLSRKKPAACALFGVEVALAVIQALFVVQH